ncbi:Mim2p Ecym_4284 [Eremothecium cymbalariae DBVPG|uniref:Uncharacterized protein n=1 Tax=Eremothecium cymbalariae (strain CBS 270.75 / DBVPG 7215 / KCTC 17166 / NRRL Y-17582) TaxID=931890 RepID=G8JTJ4_ERECY|nr:hypothetical protein Ecym_4284 [Eremothecium cymbalariae DBVPG\
MSTGSNDISKLQQSLSHLGQPFHKHIDHAEKPIPELDNRNTIDDGDLDYDSYSEDYGYDMDEFDSINYSEELLNAQWQWEQSLEQLKQVVNWLVLPLVGKLLGRRAAGIIWSRFMAWWWVS